MTAEGPSERPTGKDRKAEGRNRDGRGKTLRFADRCLQIGHRKGKSTGPPTSHLPLSAIDPRASSHPLLTSPGLGRKITLVLRGTVSDLPEA